jgi:hypothetical protein
MPGAHLEPGYQMKGLGKMATFTDDPSFWPILEVLSETGDGPTYPLFGPEGWKWI